MKVNTHLYERMYNLLIRLRQGAYYAGWTALVRDIDNVLTDVENNDKEEEPPA